MPKSTSKSQAIIAASRSLFWKFGIKRVSVEQICEAANCSKMTFYRNFTNKVEVAEQVLLEIIAEADQKYNQIMDQPIDFHEKMKHVVKLKSDASKDISAEFISDIINSKEPRLMALLASKRKENQNRFRADIEKAQQRGELRSDLNVDFILTVADRLTQMATDQTLGAFFTSPQALITALTDVFLFGIAQPRNE